MVLRPRCSRAYRNISTCRRAHECEKRSRTSTFGLFGAWSFEGGFGLVGWSGMDGMNAIAVRCESDGADGCGYVDIV